MLELDNTDLKWALRRFGQNQGGAPCKKILSYLLQFKTRAKSMDRIVTFVVFDNEYQVTVKDCDSDRLAKDAVLEQIVKSFHVRAITPIKPKKRTSLWATYADGFKMFFQRLSPIC